MRKAIAPTHKKFVQEEMTRVVLNEHGKVQSPSLRNWYALAIALRGTEISDFPICNKSFDFSYCGNDL